MDFVSSYELNIQGDAPGVLRDPAALSKIVAEYARSLEQQGIDTRQSSRATSRKLSNKDTSGT